MRQLWGLSSRRSSAIVRTSRWDAHPTWAAGTLADGPTLTNPRGCRLPKTSSRSTLRPMQPSLFLPSGPLRLWLSQLDGMLVPTTTIQGDVCPLLLLPTKSGMLSADHCCRWIAGWISWSSCQGSTLASSDVITSIALRTLRSDWDPRNLSLSLAAIVPNENRVLQPRPEIRWLTSHHPRIGDLGTPRPDASLCEGELSWAPSKTLCCRCEHSGRSSSSDSLVETLNRPCLPSLPEERTLLVILLRRGCWRSLSSASKRRFCGRPPSLVSVSATVMSTISTAVERDWRTWGVGGPRWLTSHTPTPRLWSAKRGMTFRPSPKRTTGSSSDVFNLVGTQSGRHQHGANQSSPGAADRNSSFKKRSSSKAWNRRCPSPKSVINCNLRASLLSSIATRRSTARKFIQDSNSLWSAGIWLASTVGNTGKRIPSRRRNLTTPQSCSNSASPFAGGPTWNGDGVAFSSINNSSSLRSSPATKLSSFSWPARAEFKASHALAVASLACSNRFSFRSTYNLGDWMHSLSGRSRVLGTLPSRGLPGWQDMCRPACQASREFAGVWWIWHGLPREPDLETKVWCWNLHPQLPKNWNLKLLLWLLLGSFAGPRNVWLVGLLPTLRWKSQPPHDAPNIALQITHPKANIFVIWFTCQKYAKDPPCVTEKVTFVLVLPPSLLFIERTACSNVGVRMTSSVSVTHTATLSSMPVHVWPSLSHIAWLWLQNTRICNTPRYMTPTVETCDILRTSVVNCSTFQAFSHLYRCNGSTETSILRNVPQLFLACGHVLHATFVLSYVFCR